MSIAETWLLPDGIHDVMPEQAAIVEHIRQRALQFLSTHGYQLIYTPLIEYIESLSTLNARHQDLDTVTFKLIDQLSGRLLGVRADMTPQVARIDAHVRPVEGVARYCYVGTILHTKPQGLSASRAPIQLGAELFGHTSLAADIEMLDVMLGVLGVAGYQHGLHIDLSHVGLFRSLVDYAQLDADQERLLSDLYQRKAFPELAEFCQSLDAGQDIYHLGYFADDLDALASNLSPRLLAHEEFSNALSRLTLAKQSLASRWPQLDIGVDAVELRSYHYHTGLMFAVYSPDHATPLAQGGRYDGIGAYFGRSRPATGFSCDLYRLAALQCAKQQYNKRSQLIVAPMGNDQHLLSEIHKLRQQGQAVVQCLDHDSKVADATHQLQYRQGSWHVVALASQAHTPDDDDASSLAQS